MRKYIPPQQRNKLFRHISKKTLLLTGLLLLVSLLPAGIYTISQRTGERINAQVLPITPTDSVTNATATDSTSPAIATVTNIPTNTIPPTQPFVSTDAYINLTIQMPGIGGADGNNQPLHGTRYVTALLYSPQTNISDPSVTPQYTFTDSVTFSSSTGAFTNTSFHLGQITSGNYQVVVKTDQTIGTRVGTVVSLTIGQITTIPAVKLISGDIASSRGNSQDNSIDLADYNALIGCFGDKMNTSSCINKTGADLDDNGVVDGIDYNILLTGIRDASSSVSQTPVSPTPSITSPLQPSPSQ